MNSKSGARNPVFLFLNAYAKLLNCTQRGDTTSKALKGFGLLNAIAWFQANGVRISAPFLSETFSLTPSGVRHPLEYLKRLELVAVVEHREDFKKWHELTVPEPMIDFLRKVLNGSNSPNDHCVEGAKITHLVREGSRQIMQNRRPTESPSLALQTIGFYIVLASLNAQYGSVTRAQLATSLNMSDTSFRKKLDYLLYLGLITVTTVKASNHIGNEDRICAGDAIVAELRHWKDCLLP